MEWIVGIVGAVLTFLGTYLVVRATRGKTQSDFKTEMDKRIDAKMLSYQEGLEKRNDGLEEDIEVLLAKVEKQSADIKKLQDDNVRTARRETLMFFYMTSLRDHIINQLPPPPPVMPPELSDWFEDFEATNPRGSA